MHRIDPRIVIIQIVLSGICAFWIFKPLAMLCEVIFLMSFLLYLQHPKEALRLGVSIARAMLKNAPIVLLDEATASVDPENEVYLQQAISTLVKDKTLIVIAHRLSTIRDAEQILVIDNGKLVQHGKHDELVLQEGIYQKYWNIRQNAKAWKVAQ